MIAVDSWAIVAWLEREQPAAAEFRRHLELAESGAEELVLSAINAGEVYYLICRRRGREQADVFRQGLVTLPIQVIVPDEAQIWEAARLKSQSRISYADGFAAALALRRGCKLLTGDPELRSVPGLRLEWLER